MKYILFIFLCFSNLSIHSQSVGVDYIAIYRTEFKTRLKINLNRDKPTTKQDSILADFSQDFLKQLENSDFFILVTDSLKIQNDTTYIKSSPEENSIADMNVQLNINVKGSERILYKNRFLIKNDTTNTITPIIGDYETFKYLSKGESILGYETSIFQNPSGTIKIWICEKLNVGLNPSIKIANPIGGILKYEIISNEQKTTSIIKKLIINK